MRPVKLLLALACCVPVLPAATDTAIETRQTQVITYAKLMELPLCWQSAPIRFAPSTPTPPDTPSAPGWPQQVTPRPSPR